MSEQFITHADFERHLDAHELSGSRCGDCGALFMPPRPLCSACHSQNMAWEQLSGRGKLTAFTVVHIAPTAMIEAGYDRDNPYVTGIVRLEEGPSISAQIVGVDPHQPQSIQIGSPVQVTYLDRGNGKQHAALAFQVIR